MPKRNKSKDKVCCFCGLSDNNELKFGKFYEHGDIITHYYCLLLSSNMEQRGNDNEGILGFLVADIQKELRRGKRLMCTYCKKSGATLGCCNTKCKRIFHYPCGLSAGALNQFFGEFRSFCVNHRPKQKIDAAMKIELTRLSEITCYICYDQVNLDDITDTIWAPCCKKNAWFHRKCVQQLAMSAGYFFKCPLCNDKKSFQKAMLEFGIFIPSQDASWELVPNAFEELLYRYDQCDAPICLCPKGRKHTSFNAKWELVLCRTCGSQGIHTACGQLKWANPTWECSECTSILDKAKKSVSFNGAERILQNTSDSEDSDSDISVGKESPVPFASNTPVSDSKPYVSIIKQRIGPQTFKLKQLEAIQKIQNSQLGCSSKQLIDKKVDSVLELRNTDECSSQFASSNKNSTIEAKVNEIKNINPLDKHSKSESLALVDNATKLKSDDDITETTSCVVSNRASTIPCVKETGKNGLYQSKETSPLQKISSVVVNKLLQTNDIKQSNAGNSLSNNINNTKINNSIKFDDLNDTIESNQKVLDANIDCISNIKITNVVSLAPEEFEKVPSVNQGQKVSNIESQNEELDTNLKRKIDKTTLNSTCLVINKSKKLKVNGSTCEQTQTPSCMYLDGKNTCKNNNNNNNTSINNVTIYTSDNNLQMINENEKCTSANATNLQSLQSHIPVQKLYGKSENLFPKCTLKNTSNNQTNTLFEYESKSNGYVTYAKDELNKYVKIDDGTRNCDGDAGRSPAAKSRNGSFRSETKTNCTEGFINSSGSRSGAESFITEQWKSRKNIQSTTIATSNVNSKKSNATSSIVSSSEQFKNSGTDYTRLIPEFVRLRDLKFRVYNSNNLQMILYNKFSVNINIENTNALEKNTTTETSEQTDAQQKLSETQNETLLSFKSENILHNVSPTCNKDKTKCLHNEQSKTYHDDIKENMDPVIAVPCKSIITDNLLTNANLTTHNLTVSTNSNNLNEEKNTIPCTRIGSKIIEENNKETSQENNNIINNIGNILDAFTNPTNRYSKSINNVTQSIQNLNSSCVTSTITGKNNLYNSTKHVQHALLPENHTNCISENKVKSITAIQFKL
ncbi:uncharacterized protein LOC100880920 isoform X2 [Megachile rotundata]|uniref:uncharacterized protein LOC100880920 isoform X2 n=1 Tax=Megachile rotundata TaxID=143995 RepID=UPI000614A1B3|nr:PREDICTED: probable cyclin-dependent serine/threonine-protein kinase DDB_G0292550 isoform X2 [Megachile rotundata]